LPQKLGQHFLRDAAALERIAAAACPTPGADPLVIEIGPGRGALTRRLAERCQRLVAIELDAALLPGLRADFPQVEFLEGDVLRVDWAGYGPAVIAGNLPYYITSPILEKTLAAAWIRAVFLVQREVAERVAAAPGSRDYGYLSVITQLAARAEIVLQVPPGAFSPPPKVDSAVLRLTPRGGSAAVLSLGLREFTGRCFGHKRKTLRNNLRPFYGRERIEALPEAGLRAEQIPVDRFPEMYQALL
jgi:16S rRNA (adenine1518-N6/adenine1519-N6)-dimethyltransferase